MFTLHRLRLVTPVRFVRLVSWLVTAVALSATSVFAQSEDGVLSPVRRGLVAAEASPSTFSASAVGAVASAAPQRITLDRARWPRGYVVGRSGVTFGTRTAPLVGVEVGRHVAPFLQVYGSFDWHRDISPGIVEDLSELISDIAGADVNYRSPSFTAVGGLKVIAPRGAIRPYGIGGVGYGRVNGTVEVEGEDVTGLLDEFGLLDRDDISFNKVLFEVGGGVSAASGRLYVDIGYRFRKFLQTGVPINMSGVYAGAGVGF